MRKSTLLFPSSFMLCTFLSHILSSTNHNTQDLQFHIPYNSDQRIAGHSETNKTGTIVSLWASAAAGLPSLQFYQNSKVHTCF